MSTGLENCRKCMLYELADKAAYESVKSYIEALSPEQRVDDAEYHRRLEICRNCDMFLSAMCRKCGCYVEVRAVRGDSHCPKTHGAW